MLDCGEWSGCESPAKLWQTCATAAAYGDLRVSDERSGDDLLHQLRIDRTQRDDDESRPRWPWIVGAAVLVLVIAGVAAVFALRGQAKEVATSTAVTAASSSDAMDVVIDTMLRPTTAQAAPPPAPAGAAAPRRAASNTPMGDETRAEISRILAASVTKGSLSTENRTYLAQLVAQRTGLSQQEAERRVDAAVTAAREAADKARRAAALTGFVTAAGLILSFGAAWWAALKGGQHRDTSIPARFDFGPRRPVRPTT